MSIAIRVENVSKKYRLGLIGSGTLREDIIGWWYKLRGKEDPYAMIGDVNDRSEAATGDYVWALRDINFEVNQGEVLGIIGRNGAGKSTLLKLLSRVTAPTIGEIKAKGRIASLLEVGTGFHPELTGKENIYLNGAIMGMKRKEIGRKLDEIVDFAGVERYIDTPVKRYSSGMYVRLAFAVAAHLEPEILIVDEVLAVGDAEFQKKCLGKMGDISKKDGRTILFVSHNMTAVQNLCKRGLLLQHGTVLAEGSAFEMVDLYLRTKESALQQVIEFSQGQESVGNEQVRVRKVGAYPEHITVEDEIQLEFILEDLGKKGSLRLAFDLINMHEHIVFGSGTLITTDRNGIGTVKCTIPTDFLNDDVYSINIYIADEDMTPLYQYVGIISFEVHDIPRESKYFGKVNGIVRPKLTWSNS